jgi:hypothetical protein
MCGPQRLLVTGTFSAKDNRATSASGFIEACGPYAEGGRKLQDRRRGQFSNSNELSGSDLYAARSGIGIGTLEVIFNAVAKQKFVTKKFLIRREDGLASDETGMKAGRFAVSLEACGNGGVHSPSIGKTGHRA